MLTRGKVKAQSNRLKIYPNQWKRLLSCIDFPYLNVSAGKQKNKPPARLRCSGAAATSVSSSHITACDRDTVVPLPQSHCRCSPAVSATLVAITLPRIWLMCPKHSWRGSEGGGWRAGCVDCVLVGLWLLFPKISSVSVSVSNRLGCTDGETLCFRCIQVRNERGLLRRLHK